MKREVVTLKITISHVASRLELVMMENNPKRFQEMIRGQRDSQLVKMIASGVMSTIPEDQKLEFQRKITDGTIELQMTKIESEGEKRMYEKDFKFYIDYDVMVDVLVITKDV